MKTSVENDPGIQRFPHCCNAGSLIRESFVKSLHYVENGLDGVGWSGLGIVDWVSSVFAPGAKQRQ